MLFAVSKAPLLCVLGALLLSLQTAAQGPGELQPILPSQPQQCSNITLSWSETATTDDTQYYAVRIIDSHTAGLYLASEVPITLVGTFNGTTSYSWRVGIPVGTNITLLVTDHNGNRGYSESTIVQQGSDDCMPRPYDPDFYQGSGSATKLFGHVASLVPLGLLAGLLSYYQLG